MIGRILRCGLVVTLLAGNNCGPRSIELEHADAGSTAGESGSAGVEMPAAGTGGASSVEAPSAGTGGDSSVIETPTAGTGGSSAGSGNSAGSGGSAVGGGQGESDLVVAGCPDYETVLLKQCATTTCHGRSAYGDLDLRPNGGLVARLKDVPAAFSDTYCPELAANCPVPPAACPPSALLVDSANWEASWFVAKLQDTPTGCGDPMLGLTAFASDDEACLIEMVKAIAALPN